MLYSADLASFFFEFLIRAEILLSRHKGVPGFPCRAILGVLEEILVFRRNIHLCLSVYKPACVDSQLMMDAVTKCGPHHKDPKQRNKWTYCTILGIYFSFSKNCLFYIFVDLKCRRPSTNTFCICLVQNCLWQVKISETVYKGRHKKMASFYF